MATTVVDVVIPTYNGLPFLRDAVESVLAQTHTALRLYVIDDGSTDATPEYVRSLGDARVRYVRKQNGGLASARNYGLEHTTGPLVAFLDADDFWYPRKLERQLALIGAQPEVGVVHAYQHTIDEHGRRVGSLERAASGRVFDRLLDGNCVTGSGSTVLVRREAFDRVGRFREDLPAGEDWEMWLRIAREYPFDCVPEHLAAVRDWPGSMQQNARRMGQSLMLLYPIVVSEFELTDEQRARVARFCLLGAASEYARARSLRSRVALVRYLRAVPSAAVDVGSWPLLARLFLGDRTVAGGRRAARLSGLRWLDERAAELRASAESLAANGHRPAAVARLLAALVLAPWRKRTLGVLRRGLR